MPDDEYDSCDDDQEKDEEKDLASSDIDHGNNSDAEDERLQSSEDSPADIFGTFKDKCNIVSLKCSSLLMLISPFLSIAFDSRST